MSTEIINAETLIQELRALRARIPEYAQLTNTEKQQVRRLAYTDPSVVKASIKILDASGAVQGLLGRPVEDVRKQMEDERWWDEAEKEVRAILNGIAAANLLRRHRLALTAHQTYQIGRQLVRDKGAQDLLPHVNSMQQLLRAFRRRPKPAPVPEVTTQLKT